MVEELKPLICEEVTEWDKIPKQPAAKQIFEYAFHNSYLSQE